MSAKAGMQYVDNNQIQHLSECVEKLTHSGQKTLDATLLKQLKSVCKLSDKYVEHAFHLITHELDKDHAEIRFSAFQICDELFRRSHCFRELVVNDMRHIMDMTAETSSKHPLPKPRTVAKELKCLALKTMQEWNSNFGSGYKKLQIGFNFLQHCKKVDFNALANESLAEQARIQERERRQNAVNQEKLTKVNKEIAEIGPEIESIITAMQNCIALLVPTLEDFFITDLNDDNVDNDVADKFDINLPSTSKINDVKEFSDEPEDCDSSINFREYGIINSSQRIEVKVDKNITNIKKSAANEAIIENARDLFRLLSKRYLPSIKNWIKILSKVAGSSDQLKRILDMKKSLENATNKYEMLNLHTTTQNDSDSSDSDFEEVEEKDGYEATVTEDLLTALVGHSNRDLATKAEKPAWSIYSTDNEDKDPTSLQSTVKALNDASVKKTPGERLAGKSSLLIKEQPTSKRKMGPSIESLGADSSPGTLEKADRKRKLLAVAPKLPFDVDLYHWEDEKIPTPTMVATYVEGAQFWGASPADGMQEIPVPDGAATLRTRVIEFSGEFKPVQRSCRAPLANGKLCPRKDRVKCPFHGKIVPRDESGQCSKAEDKLRTQQAAEEEQQRNPDWQDPELLAEIQAATGVDLKMPEKKGKGKGKKKPLNKYPGLTDIKRKQNTPHTRLSKKVFDKSVMKRISKALDNMDHKRYRDKYGDQFHYMHNTA